MRTRTLGALLALSVACCATPAYAGPPLNSQPNWRVAEFILAPSTVVVDVVDIDLGTTVGDDLATTQLSIDGDVSAFFAFDLATVSGYPTACDSKTYLVLWIPDSADCSEGATPALCASDIVQAGGSACIAEVIEVGYSDTYTHTSTVVTAQGIDAAVLNFYLARGTLPLLWFERDLAADHEFGSPDTTFWTVFKYTSSGSAPRVLCSVTTDSDPAASLPSFTHCNP